MDERVVRTILRFVAVLMMLGAAVYLTVLPFEALCAQSLLSKHNDPIAAMGSPPRPRPACCRPPS
jgi:hypothetical protein